MNHIRISLLSIIIAFCCQYISAQIRYEVTASTFLNIRSYASQNAPVIGTVDNGDEVEVYDITDGWAKIKYGDNYAYVSANYLKEAGAGISDSQSDIISGIKSLDLNKFATGDMKWLVYLIMGLSIVLLLIRKRRDEDPLEDGLYVANWLVFIAICATELFYVAKMGSDTMWFCSPDQVGWMWTIIDFILFAIVVYNQLLCFLNTLIDVEYNSCSSVDKRWGIYSWGGCAIAGIVSGIFFPVAIPYVLIAFAVCQIIQIVLIFVKIVPNGGFGNALLFFLIYVLGSVATVVILVHFIILLAIVMIGMLILYIIGRPEERSSRKCCSNCNHINSSGYCAYHQQTISHNPNDYYCDNFR